MMPFSSSAAVLVVLIKKHGSQRSNLLVHFKFQPIALLWKIKYSSHTLAVDMNIG
jgi:hypothetical protein